MQKDHPQQLSLALEDPAAIKIAASRDVTATETQCASEMVKFLLGRRGSHRTYVHALFSEILPRHDESPEMADILTHHLLGFPAEEAHAFEQKPHSTLGAIWEELVTLLYRQAFPGQLSSDWRKHLAKLKGELTPRPGDKVKAEYHLANIAFEMKYRSGSYENTTKQARTVQYLRGMGLTPLMLCLRPSPNTAEFRRAGWTVLEGDDALSRIWQDTGINPEAVIYLVSQNEHISRLREEGRVQMFRRLSAICGGHYRRSNLHIAPALHAEIARDPKALRDVLHRALETGTLRDAAQELSDMIFALQSGKKLHVPPELSLITGLCRPEDFGQAESSD